MKNYIYVMLLFVFATLNTNAQNGAKGKFLTAYQKNGQNEAMSSVGISFVKDGQSERYAWQPSTWQLSDYSTLGEAFDIKNVKSIFRYVESDNQFTVTLPEDAPITENDIIVEAYGQEITPSEDNQYSTGASVVSVANQEGKTIYDCYLSSDTVETQRIVEINALETAYTLLLPIFPGVFDTTSDEVLAILKSLLAELPETHALAEAIDRSIVRKGYLDMDDIDTEYQAAVEQIIEKMGLRNNYLKPSASNARRRIMPQSPSIINGNGVYGYKLVMNSSKWVHNDLGKAWNCNLTAYNSNRFAYTAWVRGWKGNDGMIYSNFFNNHDILENLNHYEILRKSLLKPQRVSTFMGTFTDPVTKPLKRDSWEGISNYISDSWRLFTEDGFGFDDMTWDCTKKTFDMSFTTSNDVVIVLGPAGSDLMMYYNVLKVVIDPIIKKIAKKLTNAEDEDYMLNFCIDLLADEDYRCDFYNIIDGDEWFGAKAKEILKLTWPKMRKFLNEYLYEQTKTKSLQYIWDHWGFTCAGELSKALDNIDGTEFSWNKYLKTVEKVGDVGLGILGLFEGSHYYDLALDFNDAVENGLPPSTTLSPEIQWEADMMVFNNGESYNSNYHNQVIGTPPSDANGNKWYAQNYQLTNGEKTWNVGKAPFSSDATYSGNPSTRWTTYGIMADIYLRRTFTVKNELSDKILFSCCHDDAPAEWYLNGVLIRSIDDGWNYDDKVYLTPEQCALIHTDGSKNVMAIHVHNNWGGAFADGGLYDEGKIPVEIGLPPSTTVSPDVQWKADMMVFNGERYASDVDPLYSYSNQLIGTPPSDAQGNEWYARNYQLTDGEKSWGVGRSPFYSYATYKGKPSTQWTPDWYMADIYLRRYFVVDHELSDKIMFSCSHDDAPAEWYLNGVLIRSIEDGCAHHDEDYDSWTEDESTYLTPEQRALIYTDGRVNVLAIHVHNNWGVGFADGGFYEVP